MRSKWLRLSLTFAGASAAAWFAVWEPLRADAVTNEYIRRTMTAWNLSGTPQAANLARENISVLRALPTRSRTVQIQLLIARNLEILERRYDALEEYRVALLLDERPEIYVNRAIVRIQLGQIEAARSDLTRAARFSANALSDVDTPLQQEAITAAEAQKRAESKLLLP